ncbi:hypothetical protein BGZ94_001632 [Podila epigama]|nr:hypothetical protein BGZ94_001632 [Podila epigama]
MIPSRTNRLVSNIVTRAYNSRSPRTLWTAASCSHPDLATSLLRCLPASSKTTTKTNITPSSLPSSPSSPSTVTIILASRSYPGSDLLALPTKVPQHIRDSSTVLGVVVDRVPTKSGHGVSTLTLSVSDTHDDNDTKDGTSDHLLSCKPFHLSGAESRRKRLKEKSVGKWARSQDIEERSLDTADAWNAFKSISIGRNQVIVPDAVLPSSSPTTLSTLSTPTTKQDILMFSDLEVHQFLEALDTSNPKADKVGLIASSTPFITGRPVTMFYNDQLVQDGVIGVSIVKNNATGNDHNSTAPVSTVEYPSMSTLGPAMQITRCRGNIILELDESNATRLLLDRLQATTLTKDKEYFLATGEPTVLGLLDRKDESTDIDMTKATVYKITGGDPSKGNMAVDTVHDLRVGQWVQFIHHDKDLDQGHYDQTSVNVPDSLVFTTSDPNNTIEEQENHPQTMTDGLVENVFGGSSENGFIVGLPEQDTWVCTVAHSILKHSN